MSHDWIIDVLADLKKFAHANDLPAVAAKLDDVQLVAVAEIGFKGKERVGGAGYSDTVIERYPGAA